MQLEFPAMGLLHLVMQLVGRDHILRPAVAIDTRRLPLPDADPDRVDRAVMMEIMNSHPEAVQSEIGMMLLMSQYPNHL